MKYLLKTLVVLVCVSTLLTSCVEHEVIPAPIPRVELPASFTADYEGMPYQLIKNVDGYYCDPTQAREILPAPQPSSIIYYSSLRSKEPNVHFDYIRIGLGQLFYSAEADLKPTLSQFKQFFEANKNPLYKDDCLGGVEIIYRDSAGKVWYSSENMTDLQNPQSFSFTSLTQKSDKFGDYMKFSATFNVSLVDDLTTPTDTIRFKNAVYEGYFQW